MLITCWITVDRRDLGVVQSLQTQSFLPANTGFDTPVLSLVLLDFDASSAITRKGPCSAKLQLHGERHAHVKE